MPSELRGRGAGAPPLVVELVGVPGSGKTTIATELVERLELAGLVAGTVTSLARRRAAATLPGRLIQTAAPRRLRSTLLWWVFYGHGIASGLGLIRRDAELAGLVARSQLRRPLSVRTRWHILFWFSQLAGRHHLLVDGSTGAQVLVLDDGFVHRAVHLHASHLADPDPSQVLRYLRSIPLPGLLVKVATDTELCRRRVVDRGVWAHSRHLTESELDRYLVAAGAVVELACDAVRERGAPVTEVDGTGDAASAADELSATLASRLPDPGPRPGPVGRRTGPIPRLPRRSRITSLLAARLHDPAIDDETLDTILEHVDLSPTGSVRNIWLSRRNRNVVVATRDGRKVVKLYRPQWGVETVECAHSILRQLEEVRFPAPRLVRSPEGSDQVTTSQGVAAVFDFIDGANLSLYYLLRPDRLDLTAEAGATLAQLHLGLQGFTPSGRHHLGFAGLEGPRTRDLGWYGETIETLIDRSGGLTDPSALTRAASLVAAADELYAGLEQLDRKLGDAALVRTVIHGDYGLHNILFPRGLPAVPVDFELSRLDWRVFDLISALGKHRFTGGTYDFESMKAFQRGYESRFPLSEEEVALFPDAWRFYKLQAAVHYWLSYFTTDGPVRKLESALDALGQADWVSGNESALVGLCSPGGAR